MYEKILVATDGSTLSKKAITSAIALAEFHGASLIAVKVVPRFTQKLGDVRRHCVQRCNELIGVVQANGNSASFALVG